MQVTAEPRQGNGAGLVPGRGGDVLLLSMRRLADLVAFCLQYELEDVVAEVTGADRVDAGDRASLERSAARTGSRASRRGRGASRGSGRPGPRR
jgi:hypothetical protein